MKKLSRKPLRQRKRKNAKRDHDLAAEYERLRKLHENGDEAALWRAIELWLNHDYPNLWLTKAISQNLSPYLKHGKPLDLDEAFRTTGLNRVFGITPRKSN